MTKQIKKPPIFGVGRLKFLDKVRGFFVGKGHFLLEGKTECGRDVVIRQHFTGDPKTFTAREKRELQTRLVIRLYKEEGVILEASKLRFVRTFTE